MGVNRVKWIQCGVFFKKLWWKLMWYFVEY